MIAPNPKGRNTYFSILLVTFLAVRATTERTYSTWVKKGTIASAHVWKKIPTSQKLDCAIEAGKQNVAIFGMVSDDGTDTCVLTTPGHDIDEIMDGIEDTDDGDIWVPHAGFYSCYGIKVLDVPGRSDGKIVVITQIKLTMISLGNISQEVDFTTIGGTSGGTSNSGGTDAFGESGYWHSGVYTMPQAVWFHFGKAIKVVKYSFESRGADEGNLGPDGPSKYEFFGSNDDDCSQQSSWVILKQDKSGTPFSPEYAYRNGSMSI